MMNRLYFSLFLFSLLATAIVAKKVRCKPGKAIVANKDDVKIFSGCQKLTVIGGATADTIHITCYNATSIIVEDFTANIHVTAHDVQRTKVKLKGGDDIFYAFGPCSQLDVSAGDDNDFVQGSDGNDKLKSGAGIDTILGGDGNDDILAKKGDAYVDGQGGNDRIQKKGIVGKSVLIGGEGVDTIIGGPNDDYIAGGVCLLTSSTQTDLDRIDEILGDVASSSPANFPDVVEFCDDYEANVLDGGAAANVYMNGANDVYAKKDKEFEKTYLIGCTPTSSPTAKPTSAPTAPTHAPTKSPTSGPTQAPITPTDAPTKAPTNSPTSGPTQAPIAPTDAPTKAPTNSPIAPTDAPTNSPLAPTNAPTNSPLVPTIAPTEAPTRTPTKAPTNSPLAPTIAPTEAPTEAPTTAPTHAPTQAPTRAPTHAPYTGGSGGTGGGQSVALGLPYLVVNYLVHLEGLFPSHSRKRLEYFLASMAMFGGNFAPREYEFPNGQLLAISQNTALFSLMGTTYGGDGQITFALPNAKDRFVTGQGSGPGLSSRSLGERYGSDNIVFNGNQLAAHKHQIDEKDTGETGQAGASLSFGLHAPTIAVNYIIFTSGVFARMGQIELFTGNFNPRFTAFCHGQLLPINQFEALFSLLGTAYGGDGETSFGLPDLRGRVPMHHGQGPGLTNRVRGQKIGGDTQTMTSTGLPSHKHSINSPGGALGNTNAFGSGQPISIVQPALVVECRVVVSGIFPSQSKKRLIIDGDSYSLGEIIWRADVFNDNFHNEAVPCNGQLLPISQFQSLFSLYGTTYGGDGQTTFQLPDARGRTLRHSFNSRIGTKGGSETQTLSTSQIPSHSHTLP